MNCLEFRRKLETDSRALNDAERTHASACASCAEHARRIAAFNKSLQSAVNVEVPANLEERILLKHAFRNRAEQRYRWPAVAAAVLLLFTGALAALHYFHDESSLEQEVIALVNAADYALQARGPVDAKTILAAFKPVGLGIDGPVGKVSFAGRCLVRGNLSGHMVLRDQDDAVTVFLMPQERLLRRTRFEAQHWSATLAPAGDGSIAIVAPHGRNVDELLERMVRAVRWRV